MMQKETRPTQRKGRATNVNERVVSDDEGRERPKCNPKGTGKSKINATWHECLLQHFSGTQPAKLATLPGGAERLQSGE